MLCMEVVKAVNPKSSYHKEKIFFSFFFCIYMRRQMFNKTYCGNHFMMYVSQIIMLYTFNIQSYMSTISQ